MKNEDDTLLYGILCIIGSLLFGIGLENHSWILGLPGAILVILTSGGLMIGYLDGGKK